MRHATATITGTDAQSYFYPTGVNDQHFGYLKDQHTPIGNVDDADVYSDASYGLDIVFPETHPLFNCKILYAAIKTSPFNKRIGTLEMYDKIEGMILDKYVAKYRKVMHDYRAKLNADRNRSTK
jgi:hypothetical protein